MPRSWFDFQIFIQVSNRIFLEFFSKFQGVRASNHQTIKGPMYEKYFVTFGHCRVGFRGVSLSSKALKYAIAKQHVEFFWH